VTRAVERGVLAAFLIGLGVSITLAQAALAALVLLWLVKLRDPHARGGLVFPLAVPFLGFVGATVLADFLSADVAGSLLASKDLLLAAIFFVLVNTLRGTGGAEWLLRRLFLVMALVSVASVLQAALCPADPWTLPFLDRFFRKCSRARGFYSIYMTLAGVLTPVLLAGLPRLLVREAGRSRWELPGWIVMLVALVLTSTRGAWLGFLAGMAGLIPLAGWRRSLNLIGGAILLFAAFVVGSAALGGHVRGLGGLSDPTTARERLYMWESGIRMLGLNPATGIGVGQVKRLYPRYALPQAAKRSTGHLHSSPLQVLVERGVIGLGCWLWLWGAFFVRGLQILRRIGPDREREQALVRGSLTAILGFLVGGLSEYNFGDSEVVMVAYVLMTIPFLAANALLTDASRPAR
jgi:O-antigen ligase